MNPSRLAIRTLQPSIRCFSSASTSLAPPTSTKKISKGGPKVSMYAKAKRNADGEESAIASGNVMSEVTLPLPDLSGIPNLVLEGLGEKMVGEVVAFSGPSVAAFSTFGLPPLIQKEFAFTKKPSTVIRKSTLEIFNLLDSITSSEGSRFILSGKPGSGKSITLLQTVSLAIQSKHVVIYLPSARPLIDSSTPHVYSPQQAIFHQPQLSSTLISKIGKVNKPILAGLKTSQEYLIGEKIIKKGDNLNALISLGGDEKNSAIVLEILMEELSLQTSIPVLLAIDDAQSLFATSSYLDPNYIPLESFSLSVPRILLNFISGTKSFANGTILLAHSPSSAYSSSALSHHLASTVAPLSTKPDIYSSILTGIKNIIISERLQRKEAIGVVEMLKVLRGSREIVTDQIFLERFIGTDGNPREFVKSLGKNLSE